MHHQRRRPRHRHRYAQARAPWKFTAHERPSLGRGNDPSSSDGGRNPHPQQPGRDAPRHGPASPVRGSRADVTARTASPHSRRPWAATGCFSPVGGAVRPGFARAPPPQVTAGPSLKMGHPQTSRGVALSGQLAPRVPEPSLGMPTEPHGCEGPATPLSPPPQLGPRPAEPNGSAQWAGPCVTTGRARRANAPPRPSTQTLLMK